MNSIRHLGWITESLSMDRKEARGILLHMSLASARDNDSMPLGESVLSLDGSLAIPAAAGISIPSPTLFHAAPSAPVASPPKPTFLAPPQQAVAPPPPYFAHGFPASPGAAEVPWFEKSTLDFLVQDFGRSVNINNQQANEMAAEDRNRLAKERLKQRLELFQMKETREIPGDGNCQMYSISDQLWKSLDRHRFVRLDIVGWLRRNADLELPNGAKLRDFVHGMSWEAYCESMERDGTWGDHLTLIAASELYAARIMIISSSVDDTSYITEIVPTTRPVERSVFLCHYAEYHYSSILPIR